MYLGFAVSLLLHAAVVGWALVAFHHTAELPAAEIPMIEATLVTASELTRLKQGDPNAKVLESQPKDTPSPDKAEKEAPKPKKVAALPPPPAAEPTPPEPEPPKPPEAAKAEPPPKAEPKADPIADKLKEPPPPEPAPGPTPDEQKKLEEKLKEEEQRKKEAEEHKKAEEKRKKAEELKKKKLAEARKKAEEAKKKQFDANKMAALLNKIPDSSAAPQASSTPPTQPTKHTGPSAGERQGNDTVLTASEIAMIGSLIKQHIKANDCWRFQAGAIGAQDLAVKLELRFQPDGRLAAEPRVVNSSANPQFSYAAESAIRAVKSCEPFNILPAEKYATVWKHMYFTFDPSSLF